MTTRNATFFSIGIVIVFGALAAGSGGSSSSTSASSGSTGTASAASGSTSGWPGPVVDPAFNARNPRTCAKLTSPPDADQASALLQCTMEYKSADLEMLLSDVSVTITASPAPGPESIFNDLDASAPEMDIVGNAVENLCGPIAGTAPNQSCNQRTYANSVGKCYKTLTAGYKCQLQTVPVFKQNSTAPPTTF